MRRHFLICLLSLGLAVTVARGSTSLPLTLAEQYAAAAAICRGTVRQVESFADSGTGLIRTRAMIEVQEVIKGIFPAVVQVVHNGGTVGNVIVVDGFGPRFRAGEDRLLFLGRAEDGTLFSLQGGATAIALKPLTDNSTPPGKDAPLIPSQTALLASVRQLAVPTLGAGDDVTDQAGFVMVSAAFSNPPPPSIAPTGLNIDTNNGLPMRFLAPDHGEAIPYLVDAQALPAGVTTNQATNAVASALQAWSAVTGIRFVFEGFTNFGNASAAVTNLNGSPRDDAKIRIQLHDTFNYIPASSTVGNGGVGDTFFFGGNIPTNWGTGGNVKGFEFNRAVRGFVVLEHTNVFLQNTNHLAEVLCHEIGHVLGMMHSSESDPEPNTLLSNAVMYFRAHNDNRGAVLGSYDPPVVQSAYPPTNTPPWTFDRVMDIVTASPQPPNISGVNQIRLQPFDLLSPSNLPVYSLQLSNATAVNGVFSTNAGNALLLHYTAAFSADVARLDPAGNSSYDSTYARVSDGTNASPYVFIKVISYSQDSFPPASDGIPNNWMTTYFGNADPSVGARHAATNDFDGDGLTNFQEFLLGSDPTDSRSGLRILSQTTSNLTFQARAYENYELYSSTNLSNWVRLPIGVLPTNTVGVFTNLFPTNGAKAFYRVGRVP